MRAQYPMEEIPINVSCHSGFKADEYPIRFTWDDVDFDIVEIVDRWYEAYQQAGAVGINYFKVKTRLKGPFLLKYDQKQDCWYLVV